jgi:MSHA pilin protein MshC
MRLSSVQVEAIQQEIEHFFGAQAEVWLFGSRVDDNQRGFTLIELIMVMVIVGILAIFAAPRMFNQSAFQSRGFADQVQATLRYAQKEAIAQRRNVCVGMNATTISLTIAAAAGAASACGQALALPALTPCGTNCVSTPSATITLTAFANFNFDSLGKPWDVAGVTPSTLKTITIFGATNNIFVEAETGYVHSP